MIFTKIPTKMSGLPTYDSFISMNPASYIWCVYDSLQHYYAWESMSGSFFITKQLGVRLNTSKGFSLAPIVGPNSELAWGSDTWALYSTSPYGMVLTFRYVMTLGGPSVYIDPFEGTYMGPPFYASKSFFRNVSDKITFTNPYDPSDTVVISVANKDTYICSDRFGIYSNLEGEKIRFGIPCFTDQLGNRYLRSFDRNVNGRYSYGAIHWDFKESKWVIGSFNSVNGWYEGSEPSIDKTVLFEFKKGDVYIPPSEEDTPPMSLQVTYSHCEQGSGMREVLLGDFAIWR